MKFTIRDLLLVTVIVALVLGWGMDHRRIAPLERERNEATKDAEWLADYWENRFINYEIVLHTEEILNKYNKDRERPNSSAPAPNPPKP